MLLLQITARIADAGEGPLSVRGKGAAADGHNPNVLRGRCASYVCVVSATGRLTRRLDISSEWPTTRKLLAEMPSLPAVLEK